MKNFKKSLITIHKHCIILICFFNTLTLKLLGLYFLIKICVLDVDRMLSKKTNDPVRDERWDKEVLV
jgi:hypothetical protein